MVIERLIKKLNVNPTPKRRAKSFLPSQQYPVFTFGVPLKEIVDRDKAEIPVVVSDIFNFLLTNGGLHAKGIFRVNGNSKTVDTLRTVVDENGIYWELGEFSNLAADCKRSIDVFAVASLLKLYLRELPEGLISGKFTILFLEAYLEFCGHMEVCCAQVEHLITQLPAPNYTLLKHLCQFLQKVSIYQMRNKMSSEALGIVFGPNVFRLTPEYEHTYREQNAINCLMTLMIDHAGQFFRMTTTNCANVTVQPGDISIDFLASDRTNSNPPDCASLERKSSECDISPASSYESASLSQSDTMGGRNQTPNTEASNVYLTSSGTNDNPSSINSIKDKCSLDELTSCLESAIQACIDEHLLSRHLTFEKPLEQPNDRVYAVQNKSTSLPKANNNGDRFASLNERPIVTQETTDHTGTSKTHSGDFDKSELTSQETIALTQRLHQLKSRIREYERHFEQEWGRKPTALDRRSDLKMNELLIKINEVRSTLKQVKSTIHNQLISDCDDLDTNYLTENTPSNNVDNEIYSSAFTDTSPIRKKHITTLFSRVYDRKDEDSTLSKHEFKERLSPITVPYSRTHELPLSNADTQLTVASKLSVEATFELLSSRLADKRRAANRPEDLNLMSFKEIEAEKLALQKALLFFENLHGRPKERRDRLVMRPLYDRYRNVKRLLSSVQLQPSATHENQLATTEQGHFDDNALVRTTQEMFRNGSFSTVTGTQANAFLNQKYTNSLISCANNVIWPNSEVDQHRSSTLTHTSIPRQHLDSYLTWHAHGHDRSYLYGSSNNGDRTMQTPMKARVSDLKSFNCTYVADLKTATKNICPNDDQCFGTLPTSKSTYTVASGDHARQASEELLQNLDSPSSSGVPEGQLDVRDLEDQIPNGHYKITNNDGQLISNKNRRILSSNSEISPLSFGSLVDPTHTTSPSDLAKWSVPDLKIELRSIRESKRQLQKTLKDFEHDFTQATGQKVERADRLCMRSEYNQYKALKIRLNQLETELKGRIAS